MDPINFEVVETVLSQRSGGNVSTWRLHYRPWSDDDPIEPAIAAWAYRPSDDEVIKFVQNFLNVAKILETAGDLVGFLEDRESVEPREILVNREGYFFAVE